MAALELGMKPTFIISLDMERLSEGSAFSCQRARQMMTNGVEPRDNADVLLGLLERYNISATWAVVGCLFLNQHCSVDNQSNYSYCGMDIVERVMSSRTKHEIGLHSFSHISFSVCSREVANEEVGESMRLARELGINVESFVFPYNSIGHVDVLRENGIRIYRGRNLRWQDPNASYLSLKLKGAADLVVAPPTEPVWREGIWEIPSSMFFCDTRMLFTLGHRARLGLERAIRSRKVFHIFLHPHDLLAQPSVEKMLDGFLKVVARKRDAGELQVMTMGELASHLNKRADRVGNAGQH